jgi:3-isopropylmalate/(R)-2-methylmalate dehydratase small subunit
MEPLTRYTGKVAPLDRANVDTDAIIPKQYLKSVQRTGFGPNLFDDWRYLDPGEPGQPVSERRESPDFVLNQARFRNTDILLTRENFGCGSSREHAVWALTDYGFRAVVAPSFADIFYNNSFKNGLLPVKLDAAIVDHLFERTWAESDYGLTVDLREQVVIEPDGTSHPFEVDAFRRDCLLEGLDDIGLTLRYADEIRGFEERRAREAPWLF